jgi:dienelactone hydrolase
MANESSNTQPADQGAAESVGSSFFKRIGRWFVRLWKRIVPGQRAWRGAAWALLVGTALIYLILAYTVLAEPSPNFASLIVTFAIPVALAAAGGLVVLLIRILIYLPIRYTWTLAGSIGILLLLSAPFKTPLPAIGVALALSLTGAGAWVVFGGGLKDTTITQRCIAISGATLGTAALVFGIVWLSTDGCMPKEVPDAALKAVSHVATITLQDPSIAGPYRARSLTYGSGTSTRRPEFGSRADLKSRTVDGSKLVGNWEGRAGWARTRYWGIDAKHMPLQGRVWYPDADGRFPLVLIVHGNHQMEEFSDPGYGYLGELLASCGYIVVSVDENFLNSSFSDLIGVPEIGLKEENDARGWVLLEHLKQWREWNESAGSPFRGKVDMSSIALIGHSRGGEAVAAAALFNRLPYYPDNARVAFDYNFAIRSVIAIAPADGQYKPAGTGIKLRDVNYFVLHGSMDGDVSSFSGSRVFERVRFTGNEYLFKATLYIQGANHGQFNTVWGRSDAGRSYAPFLNLKAIMPAQDQQKIAKVFMSAFLDATLRGRKEYIPLFRDYRAGRTWLPKCIYLQDFEDSTYKYVSTYEEDIDLTTTTMPGGKLSAANFSDWKEEEISLKWGTLDTRAVYLGWNPEEFPGEASYTVTLPEHGLTTDSGSVLVFALADAKEKPSKRDEEEGASDKKKTDKDKKKEEEESKEPRQPIDLTLEVTDLAGAKARLPLSYCAFLQPQLEAVIPKAEFMDPKQKSEIVFRSFEFPLAAFVEVNHSLDPTRLKTIRFVFDRTQKGVVILDDLGFRSGQ